MYGWQETGIKFDSIFRTNIAKHKMLSTSPIIITKWYPAAHIDFNVCGRTGQQTIGIEALLKSDAQNPFLPKILLEALYAEGTNPDARKALAPLLAQAMERSSAIECSSLLLCVLLLSTYN